jgi:hypothetical protein
LYNELLAEFGTESLQIDPRTAQRVLLLPGSGLRQTFRSTRFEGELLNKIENEALTNDKICWDSVKYCAFKAGAITKYQYKLIKGKTDLATPFDKRIHNAN